MNYNIVRNGIQMYLENEMMNKISGLQRWIIGAGLAMALQKSDNIMEALKHNGIVKTLEIMDDYGNVDIEMIYNALLQQAEKCSATISIPMLGDVTFHRNDVDKLYQYIKQAE